MSRSHLLEHQHTASSSTQFASQAHLRLKLEQAALKSVGTCMEWKPDLWRRAVFEVCANPKFCPHTHTHTHAHTHTPCAQRREAHPPHTHRVPTETTSMSFSPLRACRVSICRGGRMNGRMAKPLSLSPSGPLSLPPPSPSPSIPPSLLPLSLLTKSCPLAHGLH